jgi:hypothetical protein
MTWIASYVVLGAVAGVLAGLLGIGGGLVIVPFLTFMFTAQGFAPDYIVHMALGTSLASIIFTSMSSVMAHHKRGAVVWPVVFRITPGIIAGSLFGTVVAAQLSSAVLKGFFSAFLYYVATQMLIGIKPKPSRSTPKTAGMFAAGGTIGIFSSLAGIGGGTLTVPFLVWCNTIMHKAIGTAAAVGFPIAIAGTAGYIANGLSVAEALPGHTLGFIHLTALASIVAASVLTAPIGAWLAHRLPVDKLKKIFAFLLFLLATRMLVSLF